MTMDDLLTTAAYLQIKKEFDGKPPPPPDEEDPLLLQVMADPARYGLHG